MTLAKLGHKPISTFAWNFAKSSMGLMNDSFLAVQSRVTCFQNGEIKKQEKELQSLRNDVNKHASEYDSHYSGGDSFKLPVVWARRSSRRSLPSWRRAKLWPKVWHMMWYGLLEEWNLSAKACILTTFEWLLESSRNLTIMEFGSAITRRCTFGWRESWKNHF